MQCCWRPPKLDSTRQPVGTLTGMVLCLNTEVLFWQQIVWFQYQRDRILNIMNCHQLQAGWSCILKSSNCINVRRASRRHSQVNAGSFYISREQQIGLSSICIVTFRWAMYGLLFGEGLPYLSQTVKYSWASKICMYCFHICLHINTYWTETMHRKYILKKIL